MEEKKKNWFEKIKEAMSTPVDLFFTSKEEQELKLKEEQELKLKEEQENEKKQEKSWFEKFKYTMTTPVDQLWAEAVEDGWLEKVKEKASASLLSFGKKEKTLETEEEKQGWLQKLQSRLKQTREEFVEKIYRLTHGKTKIDDELIEEIEDILLQSDVGVSVTEDIINYIQNLAKEKRLLPTEVFPSLTEYLKNLLTSNSERFFIEEGKLNIVILVGVNGTGKTTTIGKMAARLKLSGYKVMIAAADTFRAAAIDQLEIWANRAGVGIVRHKEGGDAAAVVFDAIQSAKSKKMDVVLIDTAGRLHNKTNLMNELNKIKKIIDREAGPNSKIESLLVLDATTGQNGLNQAKVFAEVTNLTGVILTKLDGTAKGGVIFGIKKSLNIPIKLVGVGEGIEDLRDFDPEQFSEALFSKQEI